MSESIFDISALLASLFARLTAARLLFENERNAEAGLFGAVGSFTCSRKKSVS
jgi:hypothetical protein